MNEKVVGITVLDQVRARIDRIENSLSDPALKSGGGGGTSGFMEERVTRLETHMEYVRRDLDDIKSGQTALLAAVQDLKTEITSTRGTAAGKVTVITTGIAVVAILLAVIAFGGDRFNQGMDVAAAIQAKPSAPAEPWINDPVVPVPAPQK